MLLSEVALGNMHELLQAEYIEKLPRGTYSVKGCGKNAPDPREQQEVLSYDGSKLIVPLG